MTEQELIECQFEIALKCLAKIAFLPRRYPNPCPEALARRAMMQLSQLQSEFEGESQPATEPSAPRTAPNPKAESASGDNP